MMNTKNMMNNQVYDTTPVFFCGAGYTIKPAGKKETSNNEELEAKLDALSKDVQRLIKGQKENNLLLREVLKTYGKTTKFPITSMEALQDVENEIEEKRDKYLKILEKILYHVGLAKGLEKILTLDIILQFNYDGTQNKLAFKRYEAFNSVLYEVLKKINGEGYDKKEYEKEVKAAYKLAKNRYYKNVSVTKKKKMANMQKTALFTQE